MLLADLSLEAASRVSEKENQLVLNGGSRESNRKARGVHPFFGNTLSTHLLPLQKGAHPTGECVPGSLPLDAQP